MGEDDSFSYSDIEHYIPPNNPHNYISKEKYLNRKFGKGVMKSIEKEREGMARLFNSVENEVDEDVQRLLLEAFRSQLSVLDDLEDEVTPIEKIPKSDR